LVFSERAGRERIDAFRTKEEGEPYGKEKGIDKEKSADNEENPCKEKSTDKGAKRDKIHWPGY
jgi:hypothetical protein